MTHPTNEKRAAWARLALDTFRNQVGEDDDATLILDLITDLGHLARARGIDFVALVARAVSVWAYERKHPRWHRREPAGRHRRRRTPAKIRLAPEGVCRMTLHIAPNRFRPDNRAIQQAAHMRYCWAVWKPGHTGRPTF